MRGSRLHYGKGCESASTRATAAGPRSARSCASTTPCGRGPPQCGASTAEVRASGRRGRHASHAARERNARPWLEGTTTVEEVIRARRWGSGESLIRPSHHTVTISIDRKSWLSGQFRGGTGETHPRSTPLRSGRWRGIQRKVSAQAARHSGGAVAGERRSEPCAREAGLGARRQRLHRPAGDAQLGRHPDRSRADDPRASPGGAGAPSRWSSRSSSRTSRPALPCRRRWPSTSACSTPCTRPWCTPARRAASSTAVLQRLAASTASELEEIKAKILGAMVYPSVIVVVAV